MSDNQRDDRTQQQREEAESRDTGGDAEAAGTLEEREALARDEDDEFGPGGDDAADGDDS